MRDREMRDVFIDATYDDWRRVARALLASHVEPAAVVWHMRGSAQESLLASCECDTEIPAVHGQPDGAFRVSPEFLRVAVSVACHRDTERWSALYRVLFRVTHGEPSLLDVATDPDVHRLAVMDKAIRRDVHKMHAFVRFRAVAAAGDGVSDSVSAHAVQNRDDTTYVAWFEPGHHIVQRATPFFARRFRSMRWSILTPDECAHWDGETLRFTPGVSQTMAPGNDALEELWRSYYAHIFNPARVATGVMHAEMPKRYWRNLPEARLIAGLTREAPARVARMLTQLSAPAAVIPDELRSLIGDVTVPARSSPALAPSFGDLDIAGDDAVHDPGFGAARARAVAARARAVAARTLAFEAATSSAGVRSADITDGDDDGRIDRGHDRENGHGREGEQGHERVTVLENAQVRERARGHEDAKADALLQVHDVPVRVGTASWTDPTLLQRGVFYPEACTTPESRLHYYASQFPLVEVDATFYSPPTRSMAAAWATRSPAHFVFDIKAFALMTGHAAETKRLPDWLRRVLPRSLTGAERVYAKDLANGIVDDIWARFLGALSPLDEAGKLGPILLQFPRWFTPTRANATALHLARERLGRIAAAVEFRNPAWLDGRLRARTQALLERLEFTYVIVDAPPGTASSMPADALVTTPGLSIVRLHGRRSAAWETRHRVVSERYRYLYDARELHEWSTRIADVAWHLGRERASFPDMPKAKQGVHVVFNNCHANYGTSNASEITQMLVEFDRQRQRSSVVMRD
jgi:probable DNA metabolism protein